MCVCVYIREEEKVSLTLRRRVPMESSARCAYIYKCGFLSLGKATNRYCEKLILDSISIDYSSYIGDIWASYSVYVYI